MSIFLLFYGICGLALCGCDAPMCVMRMRAYVSVLRAYRAYMELYDSGRSVTYPTKKDALKTKENEQSAVYDIALTRKARMPTKKVCSPMKEYRQSAVYNCVADTETSGF